MKNILILSDKVKSALKEGKPVVALESALISHGLPLPINIETSLSMEKVIEDNGAIPATIGIVRGKIKIGLSEEEIEWFAKNKPRKVGMREIPVILALGENGATTVSGTMLCASKVGIKVFVTGGIGGVHRNVNETMDISQDLIAFTKFNMIVVSSGVKSILDIRKTNELLETFGVVTLGYRTDEMPSFYSSKSGINIKKIFNVEEIVDIFKKVEKIYFGSVLVMNPVPKKDEIPREKIERWMELSENEMKKYGIFGKDVTPFLLSKLSILSKGKTIKTNVSLLLNNAKLSAEIAKTLSIKMSD